MFNPRLVWIFKGLVKNLAVTAYVRGCVDSGMDENKALEQFTQKYVSEDFPEGDELELLKEFTRLQRLLKIK